jgi:hypothetical protein
VELEANGGEDGVADGNEGLNVDVESRVAGVELAGLVLGRVGSGDGRGDGEESEEGLGEHYERYEVGVGGSEESGVVVCECEVVVRSGVRRRSVD